MSFGSGATLQLPAPPFAPALENVRLLGPRARIIRARGVLRVITAAFRTSPVRRVLLLEPYLRTFAATCYAAPVSSNECQAASEVISLNQSHSMSPTLRFVTFILVTIAVFLWLIRFSLRGRESKLPRVPLLAVTLIVVVGGMVFAKYGANVGLPWWIYYTVPALLTLFLPPLVLRMSRAEVPTYLALAFLSSPFIHATFSLVLGWKEYMPFIPIPSVQELVR